jgi:hypothetical protein
MAPATAVLDSTVHDDEKLRIAAFERPWRACPTRRFALGQTDEATEQGFRGSRRLEDAMTRRPSGATPHAERTSSLQLPGSSSRGPRSGVVIVVRRSGERLQRLSHRIRQISLHKELALERLSQSLDCGFLHGGCSMAGVVDLQAQQ